MTPDESRPRDARAIFASAVAAVDPAGRLGRALADVVPEGDAVWIISLGKAAPALAAAAVERLGALGLTPAGGLVVTTPPQPFVPAPLDVVVGNHPVPGPGSFAAARALGRLCARVPPGDEVWVLVSGGTSSLVAAPVDGLAASDFVAFHRALARAGLPIAELNQARKRFSRWGAGRLLRALGPARVRVYGLSDVPGDDPADIGSGPCEPDPTTATRIRALLERGGLLARLPPSIESWLARVEAGLEPETPKPGDPIFASRRTQVIASNRTAVQAAAHRARELGYRPRVSEEVLHGEAAEAGRRLAAEVLAAVQPGPGTALIWGGETTVTLPEDHGLGGRSQELALAAAQTLATRPEAPVVLLAAGTDGRDGPTDAAGAVVDPATWAALAAAGVDGALALARHDAHPALAEAGALLYTGPTGTNVMDLVIGLAGGNQSGGAPGGSV